MVKRVKLNKNFLVNGKLAKKDTIYEVYAINTRLIEGMEVLKNATRLNEMILTKGHILKKVEEAEVKESTDKEQLKEDKQDIMVASSKLIDLVSDSLNPLNSSDRDLGYKVGQSLGEAFYALVRNNQYTDFKEFFKGVIKGIS